MTVRGLGRRGGPGADAAVHGSKAAVPRYRFWRPATRAAMGRGSMTRLREIRRQDACNNGAVFLAVRCEMQQKQSAILILDAARRPASWARIGRGGLAGAWCSLLAALAAAPFGPSRVAPSRSTAR
ncbi:hypothetical protein BCR34DRAFT_581960 [Clohesyomyces aquaticus]|uniref:Uncharacterized protein n=1 Tax=Clohesyomyces aquaticus TaxID=1231657 RepID=A0A1Y2ABR5_9PLEO|nr:hypothetical protein BCR34DRAFT_581960 [Clohesyomyces aquaticus]